MLDELGETRWDAHLLPDEWSQVLPGQAVVSRTEYIARAENAEIRQLAERFTQRLDRLGRQTREQVAERAARLEMDREWRIQAVERRREPRGDSAAPVCGHTCTDPVESTNASRRSRRT